MSAAANTFGYKYDKDGNLIGIETLYAATQYFKQTFQRKHLDNPIIRSFNIIDQVKGDFITDYSKSFNKDFDKLDENAPLPPSSNDFEIASRNDIKKFTICWIIEVKYASPFGIFDNKFYYVIFRKKWFNRWANTYYERAKRYFDKDGITIKIDILLNSMKSPVTNTQIARQSTLVLVTGDCSIYYMPLENVFELANKKLGIFVDKWNQTCVGIPKTEFSLNEDTTNYG